MSSPTVTTFAASVGEAPANFALFARALRDKVFQALSYQLDSVWDNADVVLQRGSGSCSEYSFVTSAAWRLNGYPTRFVGASTGRNALASGQPDRVHHRWIEIFAPGIGWVPMDCNHNDSGSLTPFSNELVFGNASYYLELLKGGCEDNDWLGRGYTWSYATTSGTVDVDGAYEWSWR
jgi:transglutaminase-like putative cysteine protease